MQGFTTENIRSAASIIADHAEQIADMLNTADGKLGDGDLGITVSKGWREIANDSGGFPEDVGMALLECAKSFQRASSSSFGTLMATGFMNAAKQCKGMTEVPFANAAVLLEGARDAMMARGKGHLGDKSVLDVLDAMAKAASGMDTAVDLATAVTGAAEQAVLEFKDKPNKLGRARMFGDKSIGLEDPGMRAALEMVQALHQAG